MTTEMKVLYHITARDNVESIKKDGIRPYINDYKIHSNDDTSIPYVHLVNSFYIV